MPEHPEEQKSKVFGDDRGEMELLSVTGTEHLYLPKNPESLTREISLFCTPSWLLFCSGNGRKWESEGR